MLPNHIVSDAQCLKSAELQHTSSDIVHASAMPATQWSPFNALL